MTPPDNIQFGDQPREFFEELVRKGDTETLKKLARGLINFSKDPFKNAKQIISWNCPELILELYLLKKEQIYGSRANHEKSIVYALSKKKIHSSITLEDLQILSEETELDLYGVEVFNQQKPIYVRNFLEQLKKPVFESFKYDNGVYELEMKDQKSKQEYILHAIAISLTKKPISETFKDLKKS
ncbi:MAG: hypothetical protein WC438_03080 [Candidatus Pacearchaeota archaeon]